jgi:LAO/AO transport system kinase
MPLDGYVRNAINWNALLEGMKAGSSLAMARMITGVENRKPGWSEAMKCISRNTGHAKTVGITGFPGSGKSTVTGQVVRELIKRGKTVGVIAVDPSSPFSGGAFLGDRIRMNDLACLEGVFIRSMASRGGTGGLNQATRDVIRIMDAFGKDYILVETVGAGQDEIDIAKVVQTVLLVCAPGQGDLIQYLKSGIMEIADIYVVNKSDLIESNQVIRNLQAALISDDNPDGSALPIIKTSATMGEGFISLVDRLEQASSSSEKWFARQQELAMEELIDLLGNRIIEWFKTEWLTDEKRVEIRNAMRSYRNDPYSVVDEFLANELPKIVPPNPS